MGRQHDLGKGHVGLGERPEEGLNGTCTALRGYGVAADNLLAGGRRGYEGLFCRLAGLGKDLHAVAVEGADDGYHAGVVGQLIAQHVKVASEFVVPLQMQAYADVAGELCLLEIVEEPLGCALHLRLGHGIAVGIDHRNLLVHPRVFRLDDNLVIFLSAC